MPARVFIRAYEELNDFLPEIRRKIRFEYSFMGRPSVKEIIEAIGIPHTEVDLVLVNNEPVDSSCHPVQGDYISVYPVFESLDISCITFLQKHPLREIRFILDVHLGKLAKYLRMLGFDTLYENSYSDGEIISIAEQEQRIVLTRDKGILRNKRVVHGCWIRSQNPLEQARDVIRRLDLTKQVCPFSRCIACNGTVMQVPKEEVTELLEPGTKATYYEFFRCRNCGKVYWEGSHYERMNQRIQSFLNTKDMV